MNPASFPQINLSQILSRRDWLKTAACGIGYLALADLCAASTAGAGNGTTARAPHFKPRARRVIFLYMQGAPSHVDTFDYKPRLQADDGKTIDGQGKGASCSARRSSLPSTARAACGCPRFFPAWPNMRTTCAC